MPPERARLTEGAAALGVSLSEQQLDALLGYLALLAKWNRVYNLTAVRNPSDMLVQHLLDSLAVVAPLRRWAGDAPKRVLDVGSGAGLPGFVIAVSTPTFDVTCVDAVGKKASFIRQAAAKLRVPNLHAVHSRVEAMTEPPFDLITSRAFATLADFVALTRDRLASSGAWLAMKGKSPLDEIHALAREIDVFHVEQVLVPGLYADRCLVWLRERN